LTPLRTGGARRATSVRLTLAIVMTAAFVQLIDVSIVNVAIPSIQRELHASSAAIQLVVAGYLLAFATALVTGARLGDIFGRRRLFVVGMVGFTAASAACGAAPDVTVLVVARVVQGACSALMYPQVLSVIQVSVPAEQRGRAFGILGGVIGSALILGPVLGGLLISADIGGWTWRSIFYVNVPIGVLAALAAHRRLPESTAPDAPGLDLGGAVLGAGAVFLVVYPLVQGRQDGWPVWGWTMLGASAVLFIVFAAYERRRSIAERHPIVDASLARDRAFVTGTLLVFVFFAGLPALLFALSQYLQLGYGFSALVAGLTVLPYAAGELASSIGSNRATERLGRRVLTLGVAVVVAGVAGLLLVVHAVGNDLAAVDLAGVLVVAGVGLGLFIPPVTSTVLAGIHSRAAGAASGVLATVQQVGGALGVALVGVVLYGALGSFAPAAATVAAGQLRADMRAAGLSPAVMRSVTASFRSCLLEHHPDSAGSALLGASSTTCTGAGADPGSVALPGGTRRTVAAAVDRATVRWRALDFRHAFEWALVYELVVFTTAGLLTLTLPAVRAGPRTPAPSL
jgi:EmrB/QacA subfamily drug resistance transporter